MEVAKLNRADPVGFAIALEESGPTEGLLLATDGWVKGLRFRGGAWEVATSVDVESEDDRYEGLRRCEDAIQEADETEMDTDSSATSDSNAEP